MCLKPKSKDDMPFVELIDNVPMSEGVSYFADFIEPRWKSASAVVIDGAANATTLVEMLKERKIPVKLVVKTPKAREYGDACSRFSNAVTEKKVTHAGYDELTDSVIQCKRRNVGASGCWGFDPIAPEVDSTIVDAAALAYWGAMTSKRQPGKKQKAGY